uniref:Sperm protein 6kDa n=1 Tax=Haliotis fulgens TaxID=6456 RepID=M9WF47_HALFU|nr:sperm protein 6kDa [Haliotis fulgens]
MRVVLIVTAVFLIISLTCVSGQGYDHGTDPNLEAGSYASDGDEYGRRKRSADFDYGGGYADSDGSESLLE